MPSESAAPIDSFEDAIERIYDLNVGVVGAGPNRHERPHKPLLLLSILDFIAMGSAEAERIPWSEELRDRFEMYFEKVQRFNDNNTPENPFLYLRGDCVWEPVEVTHGSDRPLEHTPTVADATAKRVFGRFINGFQSYVRHEDHRNRLRDAIVSRYFPLQRAELKTLFIDGGDAILTEPPSDEVGEEPEEIPGRNPAFRRKVREVYDSQCAACGLRIKLPDAALTFVDGAHLIPFSISRNDHPTNGIALCKNHHWAMDRFLIVPTPEGIWEVSPKLEPRRSLGEQALCELKRQPILPPHDEAFAPDSECLRWRADRLYVG